MPIELCLESYGFLLQVLDSGSGSVNLFPMMRQRSERRRCDIEEADFSARVREATDHLPHSEAEAIWLVDVCKYSYERASVATRTTPGDIGRRVASARESIARELR